MFERGHYLALRKKYEPKTPRLVIVAESPPTSGRYFYDATGAPTEPLFSAFMQRLGVSGVTKEVGLDAFARRGWILVDATYQPINGMNEAARELVIARDYPLLRDDLAALLPDRSIPIILIKVNVGRILEPKLVDDGFDVINRGSPVYFPSSGQQNKFKQQFASIMETAGLVL
jgi:hypothetical protein